jgi:hypothetical protein
MRALLLLGNLIHLYIISDYVNFKDCSAAKFLASKIPNLGETVKLMVRGFMGLQNSK